MRAQLALGTVKCWHPRVTFEQLQTNHTRPARRPVAQEGIGSVSRVQVDPRDGQEQEEVLRPAACGGLATAVTISEQFRENIESHFELRLIAA